MAWKDFYKAGPLTPGNSFNRYLVAVLAVGVTFIVTILISPLVPPDISSLFLIAVMVSAWLGGLKAGLFATALSALIDVFIFLPQTPSFSLYNADFVQLVVDVFAAVVVGMLSASRSRAEAERKNLLLLETAARAEAEKANAVKDEFLAAVSHELRTPLTTIKTLTRLLLVKDPSPEIRRDYLQDIASECDRQTGLVHNLLDLSRIRAGGVHIEFEQVDVEEVLLACEKIERFEAAGRNHRIKVHTPSDLPAVRADYDALRRVICTIIENSIKYTPDGGSIILEAFPDSASKYVLIKLSDNGHGISDEDLPYIFERFYRGRKSKGSDDEREIPGTGLGLYLARMLIEAMNGEISVKSQVGHGSTFTIRLRCRGAGKRQSGDADRKLDELDRDVIVYEEANIDRG